MAIAHSHLRFERDLLVLDLLAPSKLDLEVVQQAYSEAQQHSTLPAEPQRAALVAKLQQALALVRGPFLDGFWLGEESPFDEWVLQEQQQWQVRVQALCERLSSWQEAGGELEQARATLTRWLALDPLSEEACRRLMRVHLALGDASAALQVYATCRARLAQGLAGGLLTTGQQIGSAVGLALLATIAAAPTGQTGSLAAGYRFSYLVATGIVVTAIVLVATQLNHKACESELARQHPEAALTRTEALLRKEA